MTEGYLQLLSTLVDCCRCSSMLGAQWRRPGAAPYVEFVTNYILPKVVVDPTISSSSVDEDTLPFRTPADRYRLLFRCLDVVRAVLCRYPVPPTATFVATTNRRRNDNKASTGGRLSTPPLALEYGEASVRNSGTAVSDEHAKTLQAYQSHCAMKAVNLGLCPAELELFQTTLPTDELLDAERDFQEEWLSVTSVQDAGQQRSTSTTTSVARPKSPGFAVLSDLLGAHGVFKSVLLALVHEGGGVAHLGQLQQQQDDISCVEALFDSGARPDFTAMRDLAVGVKTELRFTPSWDDEKQRTFRHYADVLSRQQLLDKNQNLEPQSLHILSHTVVGNANTNHRKAFSSSVPVNDVGLWRLASVQSSLHILSAAAVREAPFAQAVAEAKGGTLRVVPVLKFGSQFECRIVSPIHSISALLHKVAGAKMFTMNLCPEPLSALVSCVGSSLDSSFERDGGDEDNDGNSDSDHNAVTMANYAIALLTYACYTLTPDVAVTHICGRNGTAGARNLAEAFMLRLLSSDGEQALGDKKPETSVRYSILKTVLSSLHSREQKLAGVLLGVNVSEDTTFLGDNVESNCLTAIVTLLQDDDFVCSDSTALLASKCFEVLDQVSRLGSGVLYCHVTERLRRDHFWETNLERFLTPLMWQACAERPNVMRSMSFVVHGIARELHAAAVSTATNNDDPNAMQEYEYYAPAPLSLRESRNLLSYLFDSSTPALKMIAGVIPVQQSHPPNLSVPASIADTKVLVNATKTLEGYPGFNTVDLEVLRSSLPPSSMQKASDNNDEAIGWARNWNAFVYKAAAGASLSASFDTLVTSCFVSNQSVLFGTSLDAEGPSSDISLLDFNGAVDFLNYSISLLCSPSADNVVDLMRSQTSALAVLSEATRSAGVKQNNTSGQSIEPCSALSLSAAVLRITNAIKNMWRLSDQQDTSEILVSCTLLASAIVVCSTGASHRKRAAILSCALTTLLPCVSGSTGSSLSELFLANASQEGYRSGSFANVFENCAIYLSSLAASDDPSSDAGESTSIDFVASSARNGLCAILSSFDGDSNQVSSRSLLLTRVFWSDNGAQSLKKLIALMRTDRTDISWTLTKICGHRGGAQMLVDYGLTPAILAASSSQNATFQESRTSSSSDWTTPAPHEAKRLCAPFHLSSQLHLWVALLSALPENRRLALDCVTYVRDLSHVWAQLFTSFPNDGDLIEPLLSCLVMASRNNSSSSFRPDGVEHENSVLTNFVGGNNNINNANEGLDSMLGNILPNLEKTVTDLSLHLACNPLPDSFSPNFPTQLREEERRLTGGHSYANEGNERTWWDSYTTFEKNHSGEAFVLPPPPSALGQSFSASGGNKRPAWSTTQYGFAILGARTLAAGLSFMCERAENRTDQQIHINPLSLAKGICRCAVYSRVRRTWVSVKTTKRVF
jgi:hypothetical protein